MLTQSLISPTQLYCLLDEPRLICIDCRYDLNCSNLGAIQYRQGHIRGACFADISKDLSDLSRIGAGRHPLPAPSAIKQCFQALGISQDSWIVIYDHGSGAFAARLWWMLRFMGHSKATVLEGGITAWHQAELPVEKKLPPPRIGSFSGTPNWSCLVRIEELESQSMPLLVDSREPERYAGLNEPIDPKAGHIPGALNRFWKCNLQPEGEGLLFKSPIKLRKEFLQLLNSTSPEQTIFYCGSGVSACHNLLAMVHAGLPMGRLYAGSWSEWCHNSKRPVA